MKQKRYTITAHTTTKMSFGTLNSESTYHFLTLEEAKKQIERWTKNCDEVKDIQITEEA